MAVHFRCWIAVLSLGWNCAVWAQSPAASAATEDAVSPQQRHGAIAGRVTDRDGKARPGIPITIMRQDGRYIEKVYTQPNGQFRLGNLQPGLYAAEISQPSFLPFWKSSIAVEPGSEFQLLINLLSLADSVEITIPESLSSAAEDWKWVLRATYPARPILRFQPDSPEAARSALRDPRQRALRGTLQFAAGNESHGFGQDPGLHTAFQVAYDLYGSQRLALAGAAGWESSTPAASLRGAWNRESGDGGSSTLSVTVRQLFLPSEYWMNASASSPLSDRRVQSLTVGYEEEKALGDRWRLQMGSLYDTLSFGRVMTRWSPFGRLSYQAGEGSQLTITYTTASPRILPTDGERRQQVADQALAIPQISNDGSAQPVMEGGRHIEAQWEQHIGSPVRLQAAAFYDTLTQTAVSLSYSSTDEFSGGLLRDPFSNRHFLSGGSASSPGARVAVATRLSSNTEMTVGYTYAGTLEAPASEITVQDVGELRALLRMRREGSLTLKLHSQLPRTRTRLTTSYRWLPRNAVAVSDPYDHGLSQSEPFLNVFILQPIPAPGIFPGQFEAVADFTNLLAQGYLTLRPVAGSTGVLFATPRSFRGGFNFIF